MPSESNLAEQSNWQKAKAAFHSIEWTSHIPLPVPRMRHLDIFYHPFNADVSAAASPVWGPDTIRASLGFGHSTVSNESVASLISQETASSDSSTSSSATSESSQLEPPVSRTSSTFRPFSPEPFGTKQPLFAAPKASLPMSYAEIVQGRRELCASPLSLFGSESSITSITSEGKDEAENEDAGDPMNESGETEQQQWTRRVAREHLLHRETYQKDEGPSMIESQLEIIHKVSLPPLREPKPLELPLFRPLSISFSPTFHVEFDAFTAFDDVDGLDGARA